MGRIFTPEQIDQGLIPEPGAHQEAGRFILHAFQSASTGFGFMGGGRYGTYFGEADDPLLEQLPHNSSFESAPNAALVYGSTALGTASMRSDVDVLYTYYNPNKTLAYVRSVFALAERTWHTPVEGKGINLDVPTEVILAGAKGFASAASFGIDPLYADHLREVEEMKDPGWSFYWPTRDIYFTSESDSGFSAQLHRTVARYCRSKEGSFARGLVDYREDIDYKLMQRAVELPAATKRKVLGAVFGLAAVKSEVLVDPEAQNALLSSIVEHTNVPDNTLSLLDALSGINAEYDTVLQATLDGKTNLAEYRAWLQDQYLRTIGLARDASEVWGNIFIRGRVLGKAEENAERVQRDAEWAAETACRIESNLIFDYGEEDEEYFGHSDPAYPSTPVAITGPYWNLDDTGPYPDDFLMESANQNYETGRDPAFIETFYPQDAYDLESLADADPGEDEPGEDEAGRISFGPMGTDYNLPGNSDYDSRYDAFGNELPKRGKRPKFEQDVLPFTPPPAAKQLGLFEDETPGSDLE